MLSFTRLRASAEDTIVFLAGGGYTSRAFRPHMAALEGFHCVAVDLPGAGASLGTPWTSLDDAADAVSEVIHELGRGPVHVCAHGLGAAVALRLMARHPRTVRSSYLTSPAIAPLSRLSGLSSRLKASLIDTRFYRHVACHAMRLDDTERAAVLAADEAIIDRASVRALLAELRSGMPVDGLAGSRTSTALVVASRERRPAKHAARSLADTMPGATAVIAPRRSHSWVLEHPREHAEAVRAFVTERRSAVASSTAPLMAAR